MATTAVTPGPEATQPQSITKNFIQNLLMLFDKDIVRLIPELAHLAPVILTVGSFAVSVITLNYPIFMFALSSAEASLIYNFISKAASYIATPILRVYTSGDSNQGPACESSFKTMTPSRFQAIINKGGVKPFPHYPLYYIVFASIYCITGMQYFNEEASEMGPMYSNRIYLAILSAGMFIILYSLFLILHSCDSLLAIIFTIVLGGFVGYLISIQNASVFGKSSVDVLFIPELVKRSGMDYVCVKDTTRPS